jgi:hypothetical protein
MYNARMLKRSWRGLIGLVVLVLLPACLQVACSRNREVEKDLKIIDVRTGWYDAGIVDGKNKIVPSIAFKLQNASEEISRVQVNAIFHRINETEAWGEHFAPAIGSEGLQTNATSNEIVLRGNLGYTSPDQSRAQILADRRFVDVKVEIFGKHGSRTWAKMGEFPIERKLLTSAPK